MSIFGLFTLLSYKYVSNEEVNFYEEYLGPYIASKKSIRNTIGERRSSLNPGRSSPRGQDNEIGPFSDAAN